MVKDNKVNLGGLTAQDIYRQKCMEINKLKSSLLKVSLQLYKHQKHDN